MQNQELEILATARQWLQQGHAVILYTVVNTWGSSPRPPGSQMALRSDGRIVGSVSGGCVEDDLISRILAQGMPGKPEIVEYGVHGSEARRFGLPCGGTLRLVQEPMQDTDWLERLLQHLKQGELVVREVELESGKVTLRSTDQVEILHLSDDKKLLRCPHGPSYRLLIIGTGQLARLLAQIALSLDFVVSVCDPREEYAEEWDVDGSHLLRTMPDDAVTDMRPDRRTAIVALTHDPKLDDMALMEALASPAFYVAALGSQLNNERRRERLAQLGLSPAQIAALHGPAGISIGSKTPAEIAVSIAAQLVAAKNRLL